MATSYPQYPLFLQKISPGGAFERSGLRINGLWVRGDSVHYGAKMICLDNALTAAGLDFARRLLPGYTTCLRQKHEAALWLIDVARRVQKRHAKAVAEAKKAVKAVLPADCAEVAAVEDALSDVLGCVAGPARAAAIDKVLSLLRPLALRAGREDAIWVAALRREVL